MSASILPISITPLTAEDVAKLSPPGRMNEDDDVFPCQDDSKSTTKDSPETDQAPPIFNLKYYINKQLKRVQDDAVSLRSIRTSCTSLSEYNSEANAEIRDIDDIDSASAISEVGKNRSRKHLPVQHLHPHVHHHHHGPNKHDHRRLSFDLEMEFMGDSTLHGLEKIAHSTKKRRKGYWTFLVLAAAAACLWYSGNYIADYFRRPLTTSIVKEYESSLAFPAVTICNFNRFLRSKLSPCDIQLLNYAENSYNGLNVSENFSGVYKSCLNTSITYRDFVETKGWTMNNKTLLECTYDGQSCTPNMWKHELTPFGNCYVFNSDGHVKQTAQGEQCGLRLVVDIKREEYVTDPGITSDSRIGLQFYTHPPWEPEYIFSSGQGVAPGFEVSVSTRVVKTENLERPWGKCDNLKLEGFSQYSVPGCAMECEIREIVKKCGCRPVYSSGSGRECDINKMACVRKIHARVRRNFTSICHCPIACNDVSYQTSSSSALFPSEYGMQRLNKMTGLNLSSDYFGKNIAALRVFYRELSYTLIKQQRGDTFGNLLSNIGGILGLFLGVSVLTLFELLEYLAVRCTTPCAMKDEDDKEKEETPAPSVVIHPPS